MTVLYWTHDPELGWCQHSSMYRSERQANAECHDALRVDLLEVDEKFQHATIAYGIMKSENGFLIPALRWTSKASAIDAMGIDYWDTVWEFEII